MRVQFLIPVLASILLFSVVVTTNVFATDIINEDTILTASDGAAFDSYGQAVSGSGDRIVVGAVIADNAVEDSGAVYVYDLVGGTWVETARIAASDGGRYDGFGASLSVSGDRIVVGAVGDDDADDGAGAAYVFDLVDGTWVETAKIIASDAGRNHSFAGIDQIELSGDRIIVGARGGSFGSTGAAYVFDFDGTDWVETKIIASDVENNDSFGSSVSISGDRIVVGASFKDEKGAAYVFDFDGTDWVETKLTLSDGATYDSFGTSVSVSGDRIVVVSVRDAGAAYVFDFDGTDWVETTKLTASDGTAGDAFGFTVSVFEDRVMVAAPRDDDVGDNSGSAYVFDFDGTDWVETKLAASDGAARNQFGASVSVSEDRSITGAGRGDSGGTDFGSVYLFEHPLEPNKKQQNAIDKANKTMDKACDEIEKITEKLTEHGLIIPIEIVELQLRACGP